MLCLGAPGQGTPCCGSSWVRGLTLLFKFKALLREWTVIGSLRRKHDWLRKTRKLLEDVCRAHLKWFEAYRDDERCYPQWNADYCHRLRSRTLSKQFRPDEHRNWTWITYHKPYIRVQAIRWKLLWCYPYFIIARDRDKPTARHSDELKTMLAPSYLYPYKRTHNAVLGITNRPTFVFTLTPK